MRPSSIEKAYNEGERDFTSVSLSWADLREADLSWADLSWASASGIHFFMTMEEAEEAEEY